MDLTPLIPVVAIIAFAVIKIARLRATRPESLSADVTARFEALERGVQGLQVLVHNTRPDIATEDVLHRLDRTP